jgi:hypothetical protein
MPWPLPPGNYLLCQGIPALIVLFQEGKTSHTDPEIKLVYYSEVNQVLRIHTAVDGQPNQDESVCLERFKLLPEEIQTAVRDRFNELFSLPAMAGNHPSPRGVRARHYANNPVTITVKPKESHAQVTQEVSHQTSTQEAS